MGDHNELKYFPGLAKAGERAFGVDDDQQSITRLGETLTPVADLWSLPEWRWLRGEVLFSFVPPTVPAVAARNSGFTLQNPTGSGIIAVVLAWKQFTAATVSFNIGPGTATWANQVTNRGVPNDTRVPGNQGQVSACQIVTGDGATGVALEQWTDVGSAAAFAPSIFPQFVILPGFKLDIANIVVNQAMRLALAWTERRLFPGEQIGT